MSKVKNMEWRWTSSSHPISDIRDWDQLNRLEIRPDFQRKQVWSDAAKILLIDSILKNIPMPKVFFQAIIRDTDTYRIVIDGQQRIRAILDFINDGFALSTPYAGEFYGSKFSDLPSPIKEDILAYKLDINEIRNADDGVVREIYHRVNKYTVALNKQELRRADFPGVFLDLSEALANEDFFESSRIFTVANSKRMGDVEYVSELIALLIGGIQDKKISLDQFYVDYTDWDSSERDHKKCEFLEILEDILTLFSGDNMPEISSTRFKQKSDFYSLFAAICECRREGGTLNGKDLRFLQQDLELLDQFTAPQSAVTYLREYAIKCVSQANSSSSRRWRKDFLKIFLKGTYMNQRPTNEESNFMHDIMHEVRHQHDEMCSTPNMECAVSEIELIDETTQGSRIAWDLDSEVFQLSNAVLVGVDSLDKAKDHYFLGGVDSDKDLNLPVDEQ